MNKFFSICAIVSLFPYLSSSLHPSNYLQSLSPPNPHHNPHPTSETGGGTTPSSSQPSSSSSSSSSCWTSLETHGRPYKPPTKYTTTGKDAMMARTLHHAPMEYFQLEKLSTTKGPCDDADVGRPHRAFRTLVDTLLGKLSVGSWWYPTGGWTLVNPRTTTEISFVWTGHGCLTDMDGTAHNFGPGDVVILPKGWCGRCDIWDDVQKVCFTHEHAIVEVEKEGEVIGEDSPCIRARVTPYEQLMVPQYVNPMVGGPGAASRLLYAAGPTTVGSVMCAAGSSSKTCYDIECFHLIEGIVFLTSDKDNGTPQRCVAGDTVVLPPGWSGHHDVVEKATMLWISVEKDESSY